MLKFGTENTEIVEKSLNAPFVLSINDSCDNELKIVIALSKKGIIGEGSENADDPKLRDILACSCPIYAGEDRVYEIKFNSYIIYQCRNESYTTFDSYNISKGKYLVIYEKSRLLDYYKNVIFDFDSGTADRRHYGICTENHIIDVISNEPPSIKKISCDREGNI